MQKCKIEENPTWFILIENNNTELKLEKKSKVYIAFYNCSLQVVKNSCILVMSPLLELPYEVSDETSA